MGSRKQVLIGVITGAHGVRGAVKIKSFTANPKDVANYGLVEDSSGNNCFDLKIIGHGKDFLTAKIKGVETREAAEALKGTELFIKRSFLPKADEEEYYLTDLVGLLAESEDGKTKGKVIAVYNFGAGDVLEIKAEDEKTFMLPFTKKAVPVVDVNSGIIKFTGLSFEERIES